MQQIYIPTQNYKVLVCSFTYNQAKYITDTLNGFAIQQTNFPFVCFVIDDCSTDGEQEVIKSWLNEHCDMDKSEIIDLELANVILVRHKINVNLTYAIYLLKRNLYKETEIKNNFVIPWRKCCKYEAICEGDDYWIHPQKLQKQVNFLDSNAHCSLCYHNCNDLFPDGSMNIHNCEIKESYSSLEILNIPFQTATILYRLNMLNSDLYTRIKGIKNATYGDLSLFLCAAQFGDVCGFTDVMSVYRRTNSGANFVLLNNRLLDTINTNIQLGNIFGKEIREHMEYASLHHLKNYLDGKYKKGDKKFTLSLIATCFRNFPIKTFKFVLNRILKR